jgi:hypothetical protein
MDQWISVEERLPDVAERGDKVCLVFTHNVVDPVEVACFWEGKFWNYHQKPMWKRLENVTHWMKLPSPPQV